MGGLVSTIAFPHPSRTLSARALRERAARNQLVHLMTKNGLKIPAIHLQRPYSKYTILYSHGNAEDLGLILSYLDRMQHVLQCSVFAYEYPGYSIADGEPSEENCYHGINAAYDYLTNNKGIDPSKIVIFGRSLGTGPSVDLCSRLSDAPLAGCILQSPLESGIRCAMGTCSSMALHPLDIFLSYAKAEHITCPVFIIHGQADRVVPCANGQNLYNILQNRPCANEVAYDPVWLEGRGHNDMPEDECLEHCKTFIEYWDQNR